MNTFLEARYHEAHARYLSQCAYMHETNVKFAEQKGGVAALTGADKARFEGIQNRMIDLVAFADATNDFIQDLQQTIGDLMTEKQRLAAELTHTRDVVSSEYNVLKQRIADEQKEERRARTLQRAQADFPNLFAPWPQQKLPVCFPDYQGITFCL